ncbi:MAG: hypothetical protein J6S60_03960 [Oscillospiraceae bacterium]|nr:hypothetical protein [Oscillospiraceae bacterium]
MASLRALTSKLQLALAMRGRRIGISTHRVWSDRAGRMVTKYMLREDGHTLLETWQLVDVVTYLAGQLDGGV